MALPVHLQSAERYCQQVQELGFLTGPTSRMVVLEVLHGALEGPAEVLGLLQPWGKVLSSSQGCWQRKGVEPYMISCGFTCPKPPLSPCQAAHPPLHLLQIWCPNTNMATGLAAAINIFFHWPCVETKASQDLPGESLALHLLCSITVFTGTGSSKTLESLMHFPARWSQEQDPWVQLVPRSQPCFHK